MLSGFKQFVLRGNVVDMAVGVVIGAAFAGVVKALTENLLTPFIAAMVGKPDFSAIHYTIHGSLFKVGDFINAAVSFLLVAAAVLFLCGDSDQRPHRTHPQSSRAGRSHDQEVPGMPERDSDRCAPLQLLRTPVMGKAA